MTKSTICTCAVTKEKKLIVVLPYESLAFLGQCCSQNQVTVKEECSSWNGFNRGARSSTSQFSYQSRFRRRIQHL